MPGFVASSFAGIATSKTESVHLAPAAFAAAKAARTSPMCAARCRCRQPLWRRDPAGSYDPVHAGYCLHRLAHEGMREFRGEGVHAPGRGIRTQRWRSTARASRPRRRHAAQVGGPRRRFRLTLGLRRRLFVDRLLRLRLSLPVSVRWRFGRRRRLRCQRLDRPDRPVARVVDRDFVGPDALQQFKPPLGLGPRPQRRVRFRRRGRGEVARDPQLLRMFPHPFQGRRATLRDEDKRNPQVPRRGKAWVIVVHRQPSSGMR
jgi:hypothetical protein